MRVPTDFRVGKQLSNEEVSSGTDCPDSETGQSHFWLTLNSEEAGGQILFKSGYWKGIEASKALLLSKFSQKLP